MRWPRSPAPPGATSPWRRTRSRRPARQPSPGGRTTELVRYEPTPVVEANRAVAVAMSEGPGAGLVILDAVSHHPQLQRWPQLHVARADLLARLGRNDEAATTYRAALQLEPPAAERDFIAGRIRQLGAG